MTIPRCSAACLAATIALSHLVGAMPGSESGAERLLPAQSNSSAQSRQWVWPLDPVPEVVHGFAPPEHPWEAGNRGMDLLGTRAQPVLAIAAGTVTFARPLAGRGVVVVSHGTLRSTYEPVTASVNVGDRVAAGEVIGLLQTTQSHCPPDTCLHLGLRRGSDYLDPLDFLGARPVHLKPWSTSANGTDTSGSAALSDAPMPFQAPDPRQAPGPSQSRESVPSSRRVLHHRSRHTPQRRSLSGRQPTRASRPANVDPLAAEVAAAVLTILRNALWR